MRNSFHEVLLGKDGLPPEAEEIKDRDFSSDEFLDVRTRLSRSWSK